MVAPPEPPPAARSRVMIGTLIVAAIATAGVAIIAFGMRDSSATPEVIDLAALQPESLTPSLTSGATTATESAAPDFSVDLLNGDRFVLSEHIDADGRPVFLNLWASWCLPCRAEMPAIDAAAQRHPGVRFLGVAVQDDPQAAAEFAAEIGVAYELAIDTAEIVSDTYPSFGLPVSYLISGDGVILSQVIGEVDGPRIDSFLAPYVGG